MKKRAAAWILIFGVLCVAQSLRAQRPATPAVASLVGTWTLVSVDQHVANTSETSRVPNPRGLLVYDAAAHALEIVTRGGRAPYAANQPTPAEAHTTFDSYAGFWGSYRVDERGRQIVYRPDGAVNPNIMGQELSRAYGALTVYPGMVFHHRLALLGPAQGDTLKRFAEIEGTELHLKFPPAMNQGQEVTTLMTLKRLSGESDMLVK